MTAQAVQERIYNFSPGPATMPLSVLREVQDELLCLPGAGCSIMEMSHRDKIFLDILHAAENGVRSLLNVSDDYAVLFLQGGARLQFSMIAANLLRGHSGKAQYLVTGSWGKKAVEEAVKEGPTEVIWDGKPNNYNNLPGEGDYTVDPSAAYLYYCSNETIQGVQFQSEPTAPSGVPLICDASSDFLCRPLDIEKYGMLYACAQKNAGPAGVTVTVIRKDLLERSQAELPGYLNYKNHADNDSEWNTPPSFAIYVLGKVLNWLRDDIGGLQAMHDLNREKAALLYDLIDQHPEFYIGHSVPDCRSLMNVTFKLPSDELQAAFLSQAATHNLGSLKGHRSVGGIRASIYNAMPREGVAALADFMKDFVAKNG
ncbi:Phosphoserine aminotransferase [Rosistilla oblonga]|uniref:3-phosphoserine/phosphohydroxythreonine transaminase n=1 Tax=Rosistilla oblonga TaxID=2527990 RepID=UPI0011884DDA|nr:3-phosphoserine/phosphohydroxythreonine transaminase [Rosistilla oblonga]QDV11080.1 Phosphoserine aminotransferase [Rosistilla oblonga]